ncbi:GntR family transcriptional regulator [Nocardia arthritidis]|uniref:GntR family transcriptional regulator n=1 Tax=Nocardia arthritidis TaxID=228602 RepID=UPI0007A4DCD3|nr:GntR family transcriptional regulator [Nocardia arthritidis]
MSVTSVEPRSLGEAAYRQLRSDIVSCRLAPGQRLTERSLAEDTGFGISPVRDALTRLDHEGLVRTLPRKGYQVTPLTLKSVDDVFTLWGIIGPEIARLGLRDASADQHKQLVGTFREIAKPDKTSKPRVDGTQSRMFALDDEAFTTLALATQNDYLITIFRRLQNDLGRIWVLLTRGHTPTPDFGVDEEWVGLLERRDGEALAATVRDAIADVHGYALRIFSRWPSVAASEITPPRA